MQGSHHVVFYSWVVLGFLKENPVILGPAKSGLIRFYLGFFCIKQKSNASARKTGISPPLMIIIG
jgi:hypothetical protein